MALECSGLRRARGSCPCCSCCSCWPAPHAGSRLGCFDVPFRGKTQRVPAAPPITGPYPAWCGGRAEGRSACLRACSTQLGEPPTQRADWQLPMRPALACQSGAGGRGPHGDAVRPGRAAGGSGGRRGSESSRGWRLRHGAWDLVALSGSTLRCWRVAVGADQRTDGANPGAQTAAPIRRYARACVLLPSWTV